jgi:hypothetical protein
MKLRPVHARLLLFLFCAAFASAQTPSKIATPKEALGINLGDDFMMATCSQFEIYWKKISRNATAASWWTSARQKRGVIST